MRVTPNANVNSLTIAVGAGKAQDAFGNGNRAASDLTVPILSGTTAPGAGPNLTVTHPPTSVMVVPGANERFVVSGTCEVGGSQVSASGAMFPTVQRVNCVERGGSGQFFIRANLPSGDGPKRATLTQSNSSASTSVRLLFHLDRVGIRYGISRGGSGAVSPGVPLLLTLTFDEDVDVSQQSSQNFGFSDLQISGGTAGNFIQNTFRKISGREYTISVTPHRGSSELVVRLKGAGLNDAHGNPAEGPDLRAQIAETPFTVKSPSQNAQVRSRSLAVSGQCQAEEGQMAVEARGPGITDLVRVPCRYGFYSMRVSLSSGDGVKSFDVSQRDASGGIVQKRMSVVLDTSPPVVTLSSGAGGHVTGPFDVTFSFTEPVQGFGTNDLSLVGASAGNLRSHANRRSYTVTITPHSRRKSIAVSFRRGGVRDGAGNVNAVLETPLYLGHQRGVRLSVVGSTLGTTTTPSLKIEGMTSGHTVKVYGDPFCQTEVASHEVSGSMATFTTNSLQPSKLYKFFLKTLDGQGETDLSCRATHAHYADENALLWNGLGRTEPHMYGHLGR